MTSTLAPFPWFGGKSKVAGKAWEFLGDCRNYVEPFFGSGAVFLARPEPHEGPETLNDKDGFIANFWRSIKLDPEKTAYHADYPINESDLHARHSWLVRNVGDLVPQLEGDPEFYDPKVAGWWVYGISSWIGSGYASGKGPWIVDDAQRLVKLGRQLPHLSSNQGINRQLPSYPNKGINGWFADLSARFKDAKVCCGDWRRVLGTSVTTKHSGVTGVFLDPPYPADRTANLYREDDTSIMADVVQWCKENRDDPKLRIVLCGYEGLDMDGWTEYAWKATGGYGNQGDGAGRANAFRERMWFNGN